jgi:hypothetical protein
LENPLQTVWQDARRIDSSLRHSNSLEPVWVDVVDTHNKDGLCKSAAVFKIRQQCQLLLCQAYIFALAWMNQQSDQEEKIQMCACQDCQNIKR